MKSINLVKGMAQSGMNQEEIIGSVLAAVLAISGDLAKDGNAAIWDCQNVIDEGDVYIISVQKTTKANLTELKSFLTKLQTTGATIQ